MGDKKAKAEAEDRPDDTSQSPTSSETPETTVAETSTAPATTDDAPDDQAADGKSTSDDQAKSKDSDTPETPDKPKDASTTAEQAKDASAATSELSEASSAPPVTSGADDAPTRPDKTKPSPHPTPPSTNAPAAESAPAPQRRRPKPPARGILKPPPPPPKPTLGNRLRDIVGSVTGEAPGPSTPHAVNAAMGTFNAISGRLLSRFGARDEQPPPPPPPKQRTLPPRTTSLGEGANPAPVAQPAPPPQSSERARQKQPLKRATFVLPSLSITYPISSLSEPWSKKVLADRDEIETRQRQLLSTASGAEYWSSMRLIKLYESACRGREEKPRLGIVRALQAIPAAPKPRLIHLVLHDVPRESPSHPAPYALEHALGRYAAEALADVLAVEWSLLDLRLERGIVESEEALKPILHALLVSGTLPSLSLLGNKRIKAGGWQLVAEFMKRARSLKFIDLSETTWDRKGIEYLVRSLSSSSVQDKPNGTRPPTPELNGDEAPANQYGPFLPPAPFLKDDDLPASVQTVRLDNCHFRSGVLDALANGIRSSELRHISLRNNRIGPLSAVSLAVMIRDYPDQSALGTFGAPELAYAPRMRKNLPDPPPDDENLPPVPELSSAGGVTTRVVPDGYKPPPPPKHPLVMPGGGYSAIQESAGFSLNSASVEGKLTSSELGGASLALQRSVRALDGVERIGRLLTLDLKSNDIRNGVTYIAQVLKRNRTLRVLNLSDNRIEPAGLVALAEALKYNSTLETLDISSNPCCGGGLEGIAALRTSFTVNSSLKRLFLQDTGMTTEGAIDLAEFVPENRSLLHLDVTNNPAIGTAGILAMASGLKSNRVIRCLDVSVPANDPNLASLSQSILQSCIRNTELAAAAVKESGGGKGKPARGGKEAIWGPIKKSELVRSVKQADEARAQKEREQVVHSVEGVAREYVYRLKPGALGPAAEDTVRGLEAWFAAGQNARRSGVHSVWEGTQMPKDDFRPLVERARALTERIAQTVGGSEDGEAQLDGDALERLLALNDRLTTLVSNARGFMPPPRILLPSQLAFSAPAPPVVTQGGMDASSGGRSMQNLTPRRRHQKSTSLEISSPNFSIGDSDAESDAEELDSAAIVAPVTRGILSGSSATSASPALASDSPSKFPAVSEDVKNAERLVDAELNAGAAGGAPSSPVERASRRWVEEEAEIFRKGTRLGVVDSDSDDDGADDGDSTSKDSTKPHTPGLPADVSALSGEELRKEIMNTEVPRSPPRRVDDLEADTTAESHSDDSADEPERDSPN